MRHALAWVENKPDDGLYPGFSLAYSIQAGDKPPRYANSE